MTTTNRTEPQKTQVEFQAEAIRIGGKPQIILCASVFYFRIPREEWEDRMVKVLRAGYNCIETYIPWNYHEAEEGTWDFTGEKDIAAFLDLAAELGLWVIARPGPYICSEWDMGSLPAYLLNKEGIVLRDYNEVYLNYVKQWYAQIIPRIADYQLGRRGTIIAVQLENELDFYDCKQFELYIATLRDYARAGGIEVPVFACAGQCDIKRAGGLVEGVLPTINLYPEAKEREVEKRIRHYVEAFREQNLPLCITETGSKHFILRRELISGAKLIAPYNQVSGTNFGFTTAVNNWGKPLSYLPHDYNLGGMINPQGELTDEYKEGLLFTGLVHSLGDEIALSRSQSEELLQVSADCRLSGSVHQSLGLPSGGKLIGFANIDDVPGEVHITYEGGVGPIDTTFTVQPTHCPILPFEVPLGTLGVDEPGVLLYSTAEIAAIRREEESAHVILYSDASSEIAFELPHSVRIEVKGLNYVIKAGITTFTPVDANEGEAIIEFRDRNRLYLKVMSREKVVQQLSDGNLTIAKEEASELEKQLQTLSYHKHDLFAMGSELGAGAVYTGDCCKTMEELQHYRGYGWYEGVVANAEPDKILGYMVYNGMDIVHLYRNEEYLQSFIGDGTHHFIPRQETIPTEGIRLGVRCEIWGHSNFSDSRLPAMDIRSRKGIRGLAAINKIREISEDWYYDKDEQPGNNCTLISQKDKFYPRIKFASYNNPEQPQIGVYKKRIRCSEKSDALILELTGLCSYGKVYLDGTFVKRLQPSDSSVSLDMASGRDEFELAIYYEQKTIQESGELKLLLYEGYGVREVSCCGADEKQLVTYIEDNHSTWNEDTKPVLLKEVKLTPGEMTLFSTSFYINESQRRGMKLKVSGKDTKLLAILNGKMLGRLWLPSEQVRPVFRGGNETVLYLPKGYLEAENHLELLIEAMSGEPELIDVCFEAV